MMFELGPMILPEMEESEEPVVASPELHAMFFNQNPTLPEDNFGGLDQDLWWEDDCQDFDFGNF